MNSPSEVKARAGKLRDVLVAMGHHLKHSESLEVISKIEGYPDWNTYTADLTKKQHFPKRDIDKENTEESTTASDHPVVVAIKSDDETLLRNSLNSEVLSNKVVMTEAFYQSVVLERVALAEVLIAEGADVASIVIRELSLFEFVIHTERKAYFEMLVFKFKHLKGLHPKNSRVLARVIVFNMKNVEVLEIVKILLDQGANIDAQTRQGDTAVILAGWAREDLNLVSCLVERGADMDIPNENGDTPLIDAAYKNNIDILEYLLKNGADTSIRNNRGYSALGMAHHKDNAEAIRVLTKHKELKESKN